MKKTPNINFHLTDCMEFMRELPDKAYDLAIVDPPYGIDVNMNMGMRKGERRKHESKNWDKIPPSADYFNELKRISINQIIWGANNFTSSLNNTSGWIFWDKLITGKVDFSEGELAWTSFNKSLKKFVFAIQNNYLIEPRIHPTQKPVALYKWLLQNYAKPGDRILDTHGGSGSIAIACLDLGFDLDIIELDPDYYAASLDRYQRHYERWHKGMGEAIEDKNDYSTIVIFSQENKINA